MPHMNDIMVDRLTRSWSEVATGTANTASTSTHTGVSGAKHVVTHINMSYNVDTTANVSLVEIRFGSTVVWRDYAISTAEVPARLQADMELLNDTSGQAIDFVVATTVAGVSAVTTMHGYTVDDMS